MSDETSQVQAENLRRTRAYLSAVEAGAEGAELAAFFGPDLVQEEFPNPVVPRGARRNLQAILEAAQRGKAVMAAQQFEIRNAFAADDQVCLEVVWTGTLRVAFGSLPIGGQMKAYLAIVLKFRGGKITEQRNYDCYEPW